MSIAVILGLVGAAFAKLAYWLADAPGDPIVFWAASVAAWAIFATTIFQAVLLAFGPG